MNARLPQDANTPELGRETRIEKEKNSAQERADLSLDIQTNNRSFGERVGDYLKNKQAEQVKERMENGEKPKEFSWMTLSSYLAMGAVGAIGAYKMTTWTKSLFEKDEKPKETEKKGLLEKAKEFPWGWGLGLLAATGFVFRGTFFNWFQNAFGLKLEGENLQKFIKTLKEKGPAGFQEARENLSYESEPFIEHFAKEIHIEEKHLAELQTVSYKHFLEQRSKDRNKSYFTRAIEWAEVDPSNLKVDAIPFTNVDDKLKKEAAELKRVTQENHLADYIKKNKAQIGLTDKELDQLTIGEILQKLFSRENQIVSTEAKSETSEHAKVLEIQDEYKDYTSEHLAHIASTTDSQWEFKACLNILAKKGQIDWEAPWIFTKLNKWQTAVTLPTDPKWHSEHAAESEKMLDQAFVAIYRVKGTYQSLKQKAAPHEATEKSKEKMKELKLSQVTDDPSKLKTPGWEGIVSAATDVEGKTKKEVQKNIIAKTLEAGGTIVNDPNLGTLVVNHGEGLLISSVAIFGSDTVNVPGFAVNFLSQNYEGAAENVLEFGGIRMENGGAYFILTGAALGVGKALLSKDHILTEMVKGAGTGFFFGPAGVLWSGYKTVKAGEKGLWQSTAWIEELYHDHHYHQGSFERLLTRDPEKYKNLLKEQILTEGRSYLSAYDRMETAYLKHYGKGSTIKDFATIRRDSVLPDHLTKMEETHFKRFANLWKTYHEAIGFPSRFPINVDSYTDKREDLVTIINDLEEEWNPRIKRTDLTPEKTVLRDTAFESKPFATQVEELKNTLKSADDFQKTAIEEYQTMKAANASEAELAKKVSDTKAELSELRTQFSTHLKRLSEASKSAAEQKLFQEFLDNDLSKGMGIRAIKTEIKARGTWSLVLGVAEFIIANNELRKEDPEAYATMKINELLKKVGPDVLQMICDVLSPFGLSDWANLATSLYDGKTWLSRKEMTTWDTVSSLVFGTYSLASDTLATIGAGASTVAGGSGGVAIYGAANALEASLRAAGKSDDLIRVAKEMLPEVSALAKDLGGYPNLIKHLQKARSMSGGAGTAITAINVGSAAWAGVQILFDTRGEKPIELPIENNGSGVGAE